MTPNRSRHNMLERAKIVQRIVATTYEAGRQDRCKLWVYRNVVIKVLPISERTFFRYLSMDVDGVTTAKQEDKQQLKLF